MAVAHKILVITSHLLLDGTFYDESRSDRHEARQEEGKSNGPWRLWSAWATP